MPANRILVGITAILLVAGGLYFYNNQSPPGPDKVDSPSTGAPDITSPQANKPDSAASSTSDQAERLAIRYLELYGNTIDEIKTRLELFRERMDLLADDPQGGKQLFERAIHIAFPERATDILVLIAKLDQYELWLTENELRLQGLPVMERQAALWQKREEIFGELANDIWDRAESELERKAETFQRELAKLDQAHGQSLQELAYQLQTTVEELYGNDMTYQLTGSGALGNTLFRMESVQSQLASLPPGERQQAINDLRRQLGYPEDAIDKLAEQDQERARKWEQGNAYMSERDQLASSLSGEQLDTALEELRKEYFGNTAITIRKEEEDGFYRFERERLYGIN
jgi:hypothetical protein